MTCKATHPVYGACTRHHLAHERHASRAGSWIEATADETLAQRLGRVAEQPLPETVDSRLTHYYEGYKDAMRDAVEFAKVQPVAKALPELLQLLSAMIAPCHAHLRLLPEEEGDLARLLPGARLDTRPDKALDGRGIDVATDAELEVGAVVAVATHRRPIRPEEVMAQLDRRSAQAGVIVPELLAGLALLAAICGAIVLRSLITPGVWLALAVSVGMAVLGAHLTRHAPAPAPRPPVQVPVLPEQAAVLCQGEAIPEPLGRKKRLRRAAAGHMLTELLWGLGGAGALLFGCALLLALLGMSGCDETPAAPPFVTGVAACDAMPMYQTEWSALHKQACYLGEIARALQARPTCQPDGPPPPAPAEAPDTQPKPNKVRKTPLSAPLVGPNGERN